MATNHYSTNDKSSIPGLELSPDDTTNTTTITDTTPTTLSYLNSSPFVENSVNPIKKKNSISFPSPITNLHIAASSGFDVPPSLKKIHPPPPLDFDEEDDIDNIDDDDIDEDEEDDIDDDIDDDDENIDGWEEIEEKPRDASGGAIGGAKTLLNHHENQNGLGELSLCQKGKSKGILKKTNNANTKKKNFEQGIEEEVPQKKCRNENEKKNILCITGEEEEEREITKREKKKMRAAKQNRNNNNNNRKKKRATNKQNQLNAFTVAGAFGEGGENINCSVCSQRLRVIRAILKAFDLTL